jgi:hypothetical protein
LLSARRFSIIVSFSSTVIWWTSKHWGQSWLKWPDWRCGERCPSAFNSFELPSWMLYQDVQLLWDSGLVRGESGYSL